MYIHLARKNIIKPYLHNPVNTLAKQQTQTMLCNQMLLVFYQQKLLVSLHNRFQTLPTNNGFETLIVWNLISITGHVIPKDNSCK